jgi:large subunit ribosomal protein L10
MASEVILNQKKAEVKELAEKMKTAKLILLTEYRGINVADDTKLRKDLREANATCNVIKNNITKRALAECKLDGLEDKLVGPTAVIMSQEDYLGASKTIYKFSKDNEYYKIKGGVVDGKVMTADEIITLAKLPSRETLLSMLAGALLSNISKVAVALNEVKKQKEEAGEVAAEPEKKEEPAKVEEKVEVKEEPKAEETKAAEVKEEKTATEDVAKKEEAKVEEAPAEEPKAE